jgi:hypothetical protein
VETKEIKMHLNSENLAFISLIQSRLTEIVREGMVVISDQLPPIYLNLRARELYQQLWPSDYVSSRLPPILNDVFYRLQQNLNTDDESLVLDYRAGETKTIRIRACPLAHPPFILICLEDRDAMLAEDLWIEQKKYDLTERETQILQLLCQACSYQEIAKKLHISLNTVKFHVKNIYSKKRDQSALKPIYF